jgi:hypothetical protein
MMARIHADHLCLLLGCHAGRHGSLMVEVVGRLVPVTRLTAGMVTVSFANEAYEAWQWRVVARRAVVMFRL